MTSKTVEKKSKAILELAFAIRNALHASNLEAYVEGLDANFEALIDGSFSFTKAAELLVCSIRNSESIKDALIC